MANSGQKKIRAPIITVLGHIDHGKTSLLDYIRGTFVNEREAGGMTQHIGASFFPMEKVLDFCKAPPELKKRITLPGLLVIDTPGHTAFMNLRKRGGAVANIAILVIEVPTGPMQTTWEAVRMLRDRKVPFIIAANKIDRIDGWKPIKNADFLTTYKNQSEYTQGFLDKSIYEMVGLFFEEGFKGVERFDKITDFTSNVAIVPTSAKTGEGLPSLLLVLVGLVQQFLQKNIQYTDGPAKGVVLEVKKEQGYGNTMDTIVFDGHLKKGQTIVVGGMNGPIVTKVRALLTPKPLEEIRDPTNRFDQNDIVYAAAGVKILAPDIDDAIAGSPIRAVANEADIETIKQEIIEELQAINISTDESGIILKCDTLGSLEAAIGLFRQEGIKIRKAGVGTITKADISDAVASRTIDPYSGTICAFNMKISKEIQTEMENQGIRYFVSDIIYRVVEEYKEYITERKSTDNAKAMNDLMLPGKMVILPQFIFRRSGPMIVGVRVEGGIITLKSKVINQDGETIGTLHSIKKDKDFLQTAKKDDEVAIAIDGAVMGRNVKETDVFFIKAPESHIRQLRTKFRDQLTADTLQALIEYVQIMRKKENNAFWAA